MNKLEKAINQVRINPIGMAMMVGSALVLLDQYLGCFHSSGISGQIYSTIPNHPANFQTIAKIIGGWSGLSVSLGAAWCGLKLRADGNYYYRMYRYKIKKLGVRPEEIKKMPKEPCNRWAYVAAAQDNGLRLTYAEVARNQELT